MSNGGKSTGPSTAPLENIVASSDSGPSQTAPANVDSTFQEEKEWVFRGVERIMESFRKGESTCFQMSLHVIEELDKWTGVANEDRSRALDSNLLEINSSITYQGGNWSVTRVSSPLVFEGPVRSGFWPPKRGNRGPQLVQIRLFLGLTGPNQGQPVSTFQFCNTKY